MRKFRRVIAVALASLGAEAAQAAPGGDPNWPCRQARLGDIALASVWDGPEIPQAPSDPRRDADVAALAAQMAQRRAPIEDVKAAVEKLAAAPDGKTKLLLALAAAFDDLSRQRAEVMAGLERYGRKNHEMADRIRAENESAHKELTPGAGPDEAALQKLQWDLRVFEDRRRTASFVCEAPQAIEARIGEIARTVRAAM